jgi:glycosyltransferase involved in cell wall biosynthesis
LRRRAVAFVALYAYPLFFPNGAGGVFGGSELRAWRFARELARRGAFDVRFVVMDHGQGEHCIDGVRLIPHPGYRARPNEPIAAPTPVDKPRLATSIQSALRALRALRDPWRVRKPATVVPYVTADADLYCVYGVSDLAAEVVRFCKEWNRTSVVFAGSEDDFSSAYRPRSLAFNAYGSLCGLCHYALANADALLVQTETQRNMARSRFGRVARVVRNPIDLGNGTGGAAGRYVAWIGKSDGVKRPDLLLAAAQRLPHIEFRMIVNVSDAYAHRQILASTPQNVTIREQATNEQSREFLRRAALLANTSRFEGFPNAMLEACAAGVPVVSLAVDPDNFIHESGCGEAAEGDFEGFVRAIETLMADPARRAALGRNARRYVEEHHEAGARGAELQDAFAELLEQRK